MCTKLAEQELRWFPLGAEAAAVQTPKSLQIFLYPTNRERPPKPLLRKVLPTPGKRVPIRHLIPTQSEGPFLGRALPLPRVAPSLIRDLPEVQHKRGMPHTWLDLWSLLLELRVRGP